MNEYAIFETRQTSDAETKEMKGMLDALASKTIARDSGVISSTTQIKVHDDYSSQFEQRFMVSIGALMLMTLLFMMMSAV